MSCHTWQKHDTNNKNKRFVRLMLINPLPRCPVRRVSSWATMHHGEKKKIKFKEVVFSQTGIKWWSIHKTSSFILVLSLCLVYEMELPHILFCLQREGKRWNKETKKQEIEKKQTLSTRQDNEFSISIMVTNQNPASFMKHGAPWAFICTSLFYL